MNRKAIIRAVIFFTLLTFKELPCQGFVGTVCNLADTLCFSKYTIESGLYAGYLNIQSQEIVFGSGSDTDELSRLDWTADAVWVLGAKGRLTNPKSRFHISLDGWTKIYAAGVKMVDRDFQDEEFPNLQTDISIHNNTKLHAALGIDLELGSDFLFSKNPKSSWSLGYLYGAKYAKVEWDAYGGKYSYDNGEYVGHFPSSLKVISYTQNYLIPYLGLEANWKYDSCFNFRFFGKYSCLGVIVTKDEHWLRSLTFTDTFRYVHYWIAGIEGVYRYTECLSANVKYSYDRLDREKGHTHVHKKGKYRGSAKVAGIENTFQMLTLGVAMRF